mmetsp:Transcript_45147/g.130715  ORF Transcript_45147/g.130715 Transcript_45147/m.130715 type:complete len:360 (+) Transcript_45147:48-1127(+)
MAGLNASFLEELLECSLCHEMMWDPSSLCCGHSFCQRCLRTALQHRSECPLCRSPCYTVGIPKPNLMLAAIIREAFPERVARAADEGGEPEPAACVLPLFLASAVQLPHSTCSLHLFELRYRQLARRALDGGGSFAMVWARGGNRFPMIVDPASLVGTTACIVHIEQSQQTYDGRWNLLCKGQSPARIEECWVEAGTADLYVARLAPRTDEEFPVDGLGAQDRPPEGGEGGSSVDTAGPGAPAEPAEQLRFLCAQLHTLGLAPGVQPSPDLARFTWEAAAALAGPFGYLGLTGLQELLDQSSPVERLALLCKFFREASARRMAWGSWVTTGLRQLGPLAVCGALLAWLLSNTGSRWAGH